jgi:hypothetical protein
MRTRAAVRAAIVVLAGSVAVSVLAGCAVGAALADGSILAALLLGIGRAVRSRFVSIEGFLPRARAACTSAVGCRVRSSAAIRSS